MRRLLLPAALLLGVAQAHAGLILHYTFDETSGTTAADSSSSGNTGTLTNMSGTEWTTGKVGGALRFDGSNDYVAFASSAGLPAGSSARSISAWINTASFPSWPPKTIVSWGANGAGHRQLFDFGVIMQPIAKPRTILHKYHGDRIGTGTLTANTWHHVSVTYDGNNERLYLDGSAIGAWTDTLSTVAMAGYVGQTDGNMQRFNGIIDDVRIYDNALSASEVSSLAAMGGGAAPVPEPASVFASLGLLTAAGCGLREWRRRKKKV